MQRIRQAAAATLMVTLTDQIGEPVDAVAGVNVTVSRANGTVLVASTPATSDPAVGVYTYALPAASTAVLDVLHAVWHDVTSGGDWHSYHRVVGGFMFTITEARIYDDVLNDDVKFPAVDMAATRDQVEDEAEWICDRRFVPSYARVTTSGDGTANISTGCHDLRVVRAISVADTLSGTAVALSATELASCAMLPGGIIQRTDGGIFTWGTNNVTVDLEYGLDAPDAMLAAAAITRLRSRLLGPKTGMPERSREWTDPNGNHYVFTGPDAYTTGIDAVDAVYARFSKRDRGQGKNGSGSVMPASRTLSYDPQAYGMFRGGPR